MEVATESVKTQEGEEKSFKKWRRKERGKREVGGGGGDNAKEKGRYHPPVGVVPKKGHPFTITTIGLASLMVRIMISYIPLL